MQNPFDPRTVLFAKHAQHVVLIHFPIALFLAGVVFSEDYSVLRAAIIPPEVVRKRARFVERTNSHKFVLRDDVWNTPGVRDVTPELRAVVF